MTISDPKMYAEPWQGLKNFPLRRRPRVFDIREIFCSLSDLEHYRDDVGDSVPSNK